MKNIRTVLILLIIQFGCQHREAETSKQIRMAREFYDNGQLKATVELVDGLQDGILLEYYENGNLKRVQQWRLGRLQGPSALFGVDGRLLSFLVMSYDSSRIGFKQYDMTENQKLVFNNRVILDSLEQLNDMVSIQCDGDLRVGKENLVKISILNALINKIEVNNATILPGYGLGNYVLKPKSMENVSVSLWTGVNDSLFQLRPIELEVMKN